MENIKHFLRGLWCVIRQIPLGHVIVIRNGRPHRIFYQISYADKLLDLVMAGVKSGDRLILTPGEYKTDSEINLPEDCGMYGAGGGGFMPAPRFKWGNIIIWLKAHLNNMVCAKWWTNIRTSPPRLKEYVIRVDNKCYVEGLMVTVNNNVINGIVSAPNATGFMIKDSHILADRKVEKAIFVESYEPDTRVD